MPRSRNPSGQGARTTIRAVIYLGFAALATATGASLISQSQRLETQNQTWLETAEKRSQNSVTDRLFRSAVAAGLIAYDLNEDTLRVITPREYRASRGSVPPGTQAKLGSLELREEFLEDGDRTRLAASDPLFEPETALDLLWQRRGPGQDIRTIIDNVLDRRSILAVRDAGLTPPCVVLAKDPCVETPWSIHPTFPTAEDSSDGPRFRAFDAAQPLAPPTAAMRAGAADTEVFRRLSRGVDRPFANWSLAGGREIGGTTFVLQPKGTDLRRGASVETIVDIIGRDLRVPIGADVNLYCFGDEGPGSLDLESCDTPQDAVAARVRFEWDGTDTPSFSAKPVDMPLLAPALHKALRERARETETASDLRRIRLDDRLSLACRVSAGLCQPVLATTTRRSRLARDLTLRGAFAENDQRAANGPGSGGEFRTPQPKEELPKQLETPFLRLTGPNRYELTERTLELGLVPAIGVPGVTFGSYLGFLENLPTGVEAQDLALTFDQKMQEVTRDVMTEYLGGAPFPGERDLFEDQQDRRRAALVLMDLRPGRDQGAVRAAISYPFFSANANPWDIAARARGPEAANTITSAAWRGLDARFQPGSSMKIVSALSLARSAAGQNAGISETLQRKLDTALTGAGAKFYETAFDLDVTRATQTIPQSRVRGSGQFTFDDQGNPLYPAPATTAAACGRQNAELYGLCEALARSSNMWFAKLALAENTVPLDALYEVAGAPPVFTGAGQTLRALGLNASVPLVRLPAAIDAEDTFAPRVEPPRLPSAPGLAAGQLRPDPLGLHELNVGINAYGQNAFVTPLTLATVAGAIGLGHTLSPFIASTKDAVAPRRVQLLPPDSRSQGLMDEIRQGMAAVMAPGGTGHIRFGVAGPGAVALRPLVRGKTGTATIGKIGGADVYTHWFVGYLESEAGTPQYAFACAVSHLRESGACATVVGEWLQRLRAKGHL